MGEGEALSAPDAGVNWQRELKPMLNAYLRRVGISAPEVRSLWVEHVLLGLQMHMEEFAAADIKEQAVEHLRDAIDARIARLANLDATRERRDIAGILALLGDKRYAPLVNRLFEDRGTYIDPEVRQQLLDAVARDRPRPLPAPAPLPMPTQKIQLRSPSALWRRLWKSE